MKEISLRKAKLDDFEVYKTLYDDSDAQFLYSGPEFVSVEEFKETMYNLGIDEEKINEEDVEGDYKNYLKGIYFINVDQVISGYIKTEKKGKEVIIRDMTISDFGIWSETYLCKLFNALYNITKTDKIIIYYCNPINAKMLQRIGFTRNGCLEKIAGI